ncbi:YsnF/AvaK domain-containing protein [Corallococcus llansteffanensis]|uniref:DUF2382 domain-containing protein n=1 Tax=Corallococcus llansteffanensis TaxID=2316731 RepID=A0A3A8PUT4_9BACT|nr:YsnF/AvaK domain-containing protein [Corallococcus llansteffanensis]RKH55234.1 DUF2382 domain-containing protein [Corallococcus llansteffanensis]
MFQRNDIREGMTVRSSDGEKLGKVFAVSEGEFHIEKGLFFPKDYLVRYAEVSDIRDGEIFLNHGKEALSSLSDDTRMGTTAGLGGGAGVGPGAVGMPAERTTGGIGATDTRINERAAMGTDTTLRGRASEDIAIPVHREEMDVIKRDQQAGEVRVKKEVVVEEEVVDVPLRRERVRVERRDVAPGRPAMNASFQEETISVPLRAEQAEVTKRAVVDEEVVIHKDAIEEEQRISEPLRHEEVDVRTEGNVDEQRTSYGAPSDDPLKRR